MTILSDIKEVLESATSAGDIQRNWAIINSVFSAINAAGLGPADTYFTSQSINTNNDTIGRRSRPLLVFVTSAASPGALNVKMPDPATSGMKLNDIIIIIDISDNSDTYPITLKTNGGQINKSTADYVFSSKGGACLLFASDVDKWEAIVLPKNIFKSNNTWNGTQTFISAITTATLFSLILNSLTTGKGIDFFSNSITTGNLINIEDQSSSGSARSLVKIRTTDGAAYASTPLEVSAVAQTNSYFKRGIKENGVTIWTGNGVNSPVGNHIGTPGDIARNCDSNKSYLCTGTTTSDWVSFT